MKQTPQICLSIIFLEFIPYQKYLLFHTLYIYFQASCEIYYPPGKSERNYLELLKLIMLMNLYEKLSLREKNEDKFNQKESFVFFIFRKESQDFILKYGNICMFCDSILF